MTVVPAALEERAAENRIAEAAPPTVLARQADMYSLARLRAAIPVGLEVRERDGRIYTTGRGATPEVGSLGAGRHTVNLTEGRKLAPGLYWVQLTQGANRRTARVTVLD